MTQVIRNLIGNEDLEAAYKIQEVNTKRALESGRRLAGRKIGLTSVAVQKQLGVDQPDYGMLFADLARCEAVEIDFKDVCQPKIEAEIAFILGKGFDAATINNCRFIWCN